MALGELSTESDARINAWLQDQLYREGRPEVEPCLYVYWGCAAVKSMFFAVSVLEEYVFHSFCLGSVVFDPQNSGKECGSATLGYAHPYAYIVKCPPWCAGVC